MKTQVIRILTYTIIIIAAFTLQTSLFYFFPLADITPNLMLVTTVAAGLMRGRKAGIAVGFFCGLLIDVFFGGLLGGYAFLYMIIGFVNGFFNHMFYAEEVVLPLATIAVNDFVYGILVYLFFYMMRNDWDFLFYVRRIILPEMMYTVLVSLIYYFVVLWVDQKLKSWEKRSA